MHTVCMCTYITSHSLYKEEVFDDGSTEAHLLKWGTLHLTPLPIRHLPALLMTAVVRWLAWSQSITNTTYHPHQQGLRWGVTISPIPYHPLPNDAIKKYGWMILGHFDTIILKINITNNLIPATRINIMSTCVSVFSERCIPASLLKNALMR